MQATRRSVALLGLGTMGSRMLQHLAAAEQFQVMVYDADPAALEASARIKGVQAAGADYMILMLPNSDVVVDVVGSAADPSSLAGRLRAGACVIDMGSSNPVTTRWLAAQLAELDVTLIDAPVSGGPRKAQTAELTIMVGAPSDREFERVRPILEVLGTIVRHVGDVGCGHALKALNNLLSAAGFVAALEALSAATAFGLDPSIALQVINRSTGRNQSTEEKLQPHVLEGEFNVGFSLALSVKDVTTALDLATSLNIDVPVSAATGKFASLALEWLGPEPVPDQSALALYAEHQRGAPAPMSATRHAALSSSRAAAEDLRQTVRSVHGPRQTVCMP